MEYIDEYRDPDRIQQLVDHIGKISRKPIKLMEVCGTHTVTIFRNGIKDLLPHHITLISGPGCPVCVTPVEGIDRSLALAQEDEVIIAMPPWHLSPPDFWQLLHVVTGKREEGYADFDPKIYRIIPNGPRKPLISGAQ